MKKKANPSAKTPEAPSAQLLRLQRVLAAAGLGSRRDCESLITEGRVEVDGKPCTELGTKVDPDTQEIRVDGERIRGQKLQYFMLNKPAGVLSTNEDPDGRTRVIDLIKTDLRVYNVGRLDQSSEGLIIVTNDGDLAFRLTHPKFGVEKRYLVQCVGCPTLEQLQQLERGVFLAEGKAKVERVSIKKKQRTGAILEMVLTEGRNREIRRVLAAIGHKVTRLKRIAIGPLQLGDLVAGAHRRLAPAEILALKQVAAGTGKRSPKPKQSSGPARTLAHLKASEERPTTQATSTGRGRRLDRTTPAAESRPTSKHSRPKFGNDQFGADRPKRSSDRRTDSDRSSRGSSKSFVPRGTAARENGARDFRKPGATSERSTRRPIGGGKPARDQRGFESRGFDKRNTEKRSAGERGLEQRSSDRRGSDKWRGSAGTGGKSPGPKGFGNRSSGPKGFGGKSPRPEAPRRGPKRAQPPRGAQGKPPASKNKFRKGR
jgi:23S rRNA pseudouridine2605 synthase